MITAAIFRRDYPEFADATLYPNGMVDYYILFSSKFINQARWGAPSPTPSEAATLTEFDMGQELFIAHNLVIERQALAAAGNGAPPGESTGLVSGKSVDKVSVNYDTASAAELDAGHWNLTVYGKRFVRLANMFGSGPIQVGIGCAPPWATFASAGCAWNGPWYANEPNPSNSGS